MVFTEENVKYNLLTFDKPTRDHVEEFAKEKLCISGLYHWCKIFKGDFSFPVFPEDTERFNLIHINITPRNIPLLSQVLPMIDRNKTKLLFNVDHSIHLWSTTFPFPQEMLRAVDQGDFIFGVEPIMCELLSKNLKRKVKCIPHPVDVERLKVLRKYDRGERIGVSIHRYVGNTVLPWFVVNDLPAGWVTTAIGANSPSFAPKVHHMYPEVQPYLKFESLMEFTSELYAVVESYTIASYGRFTAECAALGVPVVGCEIVSAQKKCFPRLATRQFNPIEMSKVLKKLINDKEFYTEVVREAIAECEGYSLESSKKKMLAFLNSPQ